MAHRTEGGHGASPCTQRPLSCVQVDLVLSPWGTLTFGDAHTKPGVWWIRPSNLKGASLSPPVNSAGSSRVHVQSRSLRARALSAHSSAQALSGSGVGLVSSSWKQERGPGYQDGGLGSQDIRPGDQDGYRGLVWSPTEH